MMNPFNENFAAAIRALRENWLRSVLTMLGIAMGVASVVLLVSIGRGVEEDIGRQIETLGVNTVIVVPGKLDRNGQPNPMSMIGISSLTWKDVRDLTALPGVDQCVPLMFIYGAVERSGRSYSGFVVGCTPGIVKIRPRPFTEGRFFTDEERHSRVCVLSSDPKEEIFGKEAAVGRQIGVQGVRFRVVGVLAPEDASLFAMFSFANLIYVPIEAAQSAFRAGQVNRILVKSDYRVPPEVLLSRIRGILLRNHQGREDFGILTQAVLLRAVYRVFNIVTWMLAAISAVSLLVAGVGIMNIMLVTVTERTREIGVRKTVGARRLDIFLQFLWEAVALSVTGGTIGVAVAAAACAAVSSHTPLRPLVTFQAVALAFGVCFAVGTLFGVAPAIRAARMNPVDALRWE
ncbi:MAG: ABC transporter permease [Chthonomonadales bacterium]